MTNNEVHIINVTACIATGTTDTTNNMEQHLYPGIESVQFSFHEFE